MRSQDVIDPLIPAWLQGENWNSVVKWRLSLSFGPCYAAPTELAQLLE